jgi:23S rRNA (adenine2503-C2)-methyltransferase
MPDGEGGERGDGSEAAEEEAEADEIVANAGDADSSAALRNDKQSGLRNDKQDGGYWSRRGDGRARSNFGTLAATGFRRATICISSQVGCAVNCQFCLTAKLGIKRNLTAGEIAGQVAAVLNRHRIQIGKDRINLVFMGMGEPFLNYEQFMQSVRLLVEGMGIPESRMTVSTSGILPGIEAFANEAVRPKLALSLNASNDVVREQIMPITRKWDIAALLEAVQKIPLRTREWVTFEYVLLGGVNDQPEHAREVLDLLAGMRAKVNLIVWNPGPGIAYQQPKPADVAVFQKMLIAGGIATYIRRPRGRDIYAACGQLKRTISEQGAEDAGLVRIGA